MQLLGSGLAPRLETMNRECLNHCLSSVSSYLLCGQPGLLYSLFRAWSCDRDWVEHSKSLVLLIKQVCLTLSVCLVCVRADKFVSLDLMLDSVTTLRGPVALENIGLTTFPCPHRVEAQRSKVTHSQPYPLQPGSFMC